MEQGFFLSLSLSLSLSLCVCVCDCYVRIMLPASRFAPVLNLLAIIGRTAVHRVYFSCINVPSKLFSFRNYFQQCFCAVDKGKCNVDLYGAYRLIHETSLRRSGIASIVKGYHSFTCTPCVSSADEPYLPLPSQPQLVLIYRPRRDGRLSIPWCEVAPAEIRTCNFPITSPALYHIATSAPVEL